jgi:hypothetical protein
MPTWSRRTFLVSAMVLIWLGLASPALPEPLRFFALGDSPYSEGEFQQLEGLLVGAAEARPAFLIHVGDIKSGSSPCTDAYNARIAALFRGLPVPVAYTPGDNEWTDCWRAGGDPQERLAALRRAFYADPSVLRLGELGAVHPDRAYPENYYFLSGGALFAAIHVVGSHNGLKGQGEAANAEWRARSAANRALLAQAVAVAKGVGAGALVIFFQADPTFERPLGLGFESLFQDLTWLLRAFPGPILLIHGDSHQYILDRPLRDPQTGLPEPRLRRLEVPGSPRVAGVWVTYDPAVAEPFAFDLAYPDLAPDGPGL